MPTNPTPRKRSVKTTPVHSVYRTALQLARRPDIEPRKRSVFYLVDLNRFVQLFGSIKQGLWVSTQDASSGAYVTPPVVTFNGGHIKRYHPDKHGVCDPRALRMAVELHRPDGTILEVTYSLDWRQACQQAEQEFLVLEHTSLKSDAKHRLGHLVLDWLKNILIRAPNVYSLARRFERNDPSITARQKARKVTAKAPATRAKRSSDVVASTYAPKRTTKRRTSRAKAA